MRVAITKDMLDGSESQIKDFNLDGTGMTQLLFMLMQKGTMSITITKKDVLKQLKKENLKKI